MATYTVPLRRTLNKDFLYRNIVVIIGLLFILFLLLLFVYTFYKGLHTEESIEPIISTYDHCPKLENGKINVHVLAHSHDDVAWLKTFDQYYYGTNVPISQAGVKFILDAVINELLIDKNRRFVQVEIAFFWKWWQEQSLERQSQVRELVERGQLEFAGGAWSMNDEATTDFLSIIDNFTWGFRKLTEMFGGLEMAKPKVGWQIDPFGHSREQASIFAQLGFDGEFINRIDYQDKAQRMKMKRAEFVWKSSPNLGKSTDIFTVALYNHYSPVEGFHYGQHRRNEPVVDDKKSSEYNVEEKAMKLLKAASIRSELYNTKNIFLTWGDDFTFQNAGEWFKNIDKIIKYINENTDEYNIFYSTPGCFVKSVNDNENLLLTTKEGDFFPYAQSGHAYWTGYYTSRPTLKYYLRQATNFLQIAKQLSALANIDESYNDNALDELREVVGLMQHHDAITGTSKNDVVKDYKLQITKAFDDSAVTVDTAIKKILAHRYNDPNENNAYDMNRIHFNSCLRTNVTECSESTSGQPFIVTLYNPLSRPITHYVRLPVMGDGMVAYTVLNPHGEKQLVQVVPIPEPLLEIRGKTSNATMEIVFKAENIPPFGFRSYHVEPSDDQIYGVREMPRADTYTIGSINGTAVTVDGVTGNIKSCFIDGIVYPLHQTYHYYISKDRPGSEKPSGAYVFNPTSNSAIPISSQKPEMKVYAGELVDEIHQKFNNWVSQVIRVYKSENHVEFDWLIGSLDVLHDSIGKEVVVRYNFPELDSSEVFYTDSNGREMIRRIRDKRDTWSVNMGNSTVSGNYYPVTGRIMIQNNRTQMSVITDRPEGGTSMIDGEIELMLHRETIYDDELGMGEALIEHELYREVAVRGKHFLTIGPNQKQNAKDRLLMDRKKNEVWTFLTKINDIKFSRWIELFKMEYSGLKFELPENVRIITLEPWLDGQFLLRLEHFMENTDDIELSKPAVINIENLFGPFMISSVKEMTLGGNTELKRLRRLKWKIKTDNRDLANELSENDTIEYDSWKRLTLSPMQIRTFLISVRF